MKNASLRSSLGRVRGLGSAKHGTGHWWAQRVTSLALIPLSVYVFATFFIYIVPGGYMEALFWLRSPISATFVVLFLAVGFHHAASGLQVVIEDYIHAEFAKLFCVVFVKFVAATFAVLGILATGKIYFGV